MATPISEFEQIRIANKVRNPSTNPHSARKDSDHFRSQQASAEKLRRKLALHYPSSTDTQLVVPLSKNATQVRAPLTNNAAFQLTHEALLSQSFRRRVLWSLGDTE